MKLNFLQEKKTYHSIKIKQNITCIKTSGAAEFLRPATYFYDLLQIHFDDEENTLTYKNAVYA